MPGSTSHTCALTYTTGTSMPKGHPLSAAATSHRKPHAHRFVTERWRVGDCNCVVRPCLGGTMFAPVLPRHTVGQEVSQRERTSKHKDHLERTTAIETPLGLYKREQRTVKEGLNTKYTNVDIHNAQVQISVPSPWPGPPLCPPQTRDKKAESSSEAGSKSKDT